MVQSTDRDNNKPRGKTDGKFFWEKKTYRSTFGGFCSPIKRPTNLGVWLERVEHSILYFHCITLYQINNTD